MLAPRIQCYNCRKIDKEMRKKNKEVEETKTRTATSTIASTNLDNTLNEKITKTFDKERMHNT